MGKMVRRECRTEWPWPERAGLWSDLPLWPPVILCASSSPYTIPWKALLPLRVQKLWLGSIQECPAPVQTLKVRKLQKCNNRTAYWMRVTKIWAIAWDEGQSKDFIEHFIEQVLYVSYHTRNSICFTPSVFKNHIRCKTVPILLETEKRKGLVTSSRSYSCKWRGWDSVPGGF